MKKKETTNIEKKKDIDKMAENNLAWKIHRICKYDYQYYYDYHYW